MWQPRKISKLRVQILAAYVLFLTGCEGPPVPTVVTNGTRPYSGVTLRVVCPDASFAAAAEPVLQAWAGRTGAKLEISPGPMSESTDIAFVPASDVGTLAEKRELLGVPVSLLGSTRFRWNEIFGPYRDRLARWGSQVVGVPVGGQGLVLVYRSDRLADPRFSAKFQERFGHSPTPPSTWAEFAEAAEVFRMLDGQPSLPRWSVEPSRFVDWFFRVAASYDRTVKPDAKVAGGAPEALSFQFNIENGQPRLTTPGFETALTWLARVNACVASDGSADPVVALAESKASLAILTLEEVARLPRTPPGRFEIRRLPGVRTESGVSYTPYYSGGIFGVVRSRCTNPEAAFDLLQDVGSPERSAEVLARAASGIGPFRNEHLDRNQWLPYGFDVRQTAELATAVRGSLGLESTSPTFVLRGPDHDALTNALASPLQEAIAGKVTPAEALQRAEAEWKKLDSPRSAETLRWRRKAMGLD